MPTRSHVTCTSATSETAFGDSVHDGDTRTLTKDDKEEEVIVSRVFPTSHFGFRKITVERPLRLNFQASPERIERLEQQKGFLRLAQSKKRGAAGTKEEAEGRSLQEAIRELVRGLPNTTFKDREEFERVLDDAANKAGLKLPAPARKASKPRLLEETRDAELLSAPSLPWEIGNALIALFKRGRIDIGQARGALESFRQVPVRLPEVALEAAVGVAEEYGMYAYDAYMLECARRYHTPFLSLDRPQCAVAKRLGVEVIEV